MPDTAATMRRIRLIRFPNQVEISLFQSLQPKISLTMFHRIDRLWSWLSSPCPCQTLLINGQARALSQTESGHRFEGPQHETVGPLHLTIFCLRSYNNFQNLLRPPPLSLLPTYTHPDLQALDLSFCQSPQAASSYWFAEIRKAHGWPFQRCALMVQECLTLGFLLHSS